MDLILISNISSVSVNSATSIQCFFPLLFHFYLRLLNVFFMYKSIFALIEEPVPMVLFHSGAHGSKFPSELKQEVSVSLCVNYTAAVKQLVIRGFLWSRTTNCSVQL